MCGIHGFVDQRLDRDEQHRTIERMVASTPHRGPDSSDIRCFDYTALGHNRLSILDLSDAGTQPFTIGKHTIVFNGEIYNYKELRKQLESEGIAFSTGTDTEVLLQAFINWGAKCVQQFLGMWAFAIWNAETEELFFSRDRFGIKPFFYIEKGGRFYFASEVKSLRQSPLFTREINENQLSRTIQLGLYTQGEETLYSCVRTLSPGTIGYWKDGKISTSSYWSLEQQSGQASEQELVDQFHELFLDSLRMHLRSDVPLAATLSGGIDSSAIVCSIANELGISGLSTFSVYYEGKNAVDERPFIHSIGEKYPDKFNMHFLSPDIGQVTEEFDRITYINDFPLAGSSAISQYFVMKEISSYGIKVVLSGQGADDYLGGYMHSYYRFYAELFRKMKWNTALREFLLHKKRQDLNWKDMVLVAAKSGLSVFNSETSLYRTEYAHYLPNPLHIDVKKTVEFREGVFNKFNNFHQQLLANTSLPQLLHYEDRNSMAASIESRVPFLDHRLVELGFRAATTSKIKNGYTKHLLREAASGSLPEKIRYRTDKKGFVTPGEITWLRGGLSGLLDIDYVNFPHLRKDFTQKLISDFKNGDNRNLRLVWRIGTMNHWLKSV